MIFILSFAIPAAGKSTAMNLISSSLKSDEFKTKFPFKNFFFDYLSQDEIRAEIQRDLIKNGTPQEKLFELSTPQTLKIYEERFTNLVLKT